MDAGIRGENTPGVFKMRTIEDALGVEALLPQTKRAVVLGGGLVGLKSAQALRERGKEVHVIVRSGALMSQMLDSDAARIFEKRITGNGIVVRTRLSAVEAEARGGRLRGVLYDNGEREECEIVIVGKGARQNLDLAKDAGIRTGDEGVCVDDHLQTSVPGIYAAGDVAATRDLVTGQDTAHTIWPCATEQGRVAGANMAGGNVGYAGTVWMNSVEFFGLSTISIGELSGDGFTPFVHVDEKHDTYRKLVLKDNRLAGIVMVGDILAAGVARMLIARRVDISSVVDEILGGRFDYGKIARLVRDNAEAFPEEALAGSVAGLFDAPFAPGSPRPENAGFVSAPRPRTSVPRSS
jgi:NAD(P)H-nitrite reductase large subunit